MKANSGSREAWSVEEDCSSFASGENFEEKGVQLLSKMCLDDHKIHSLSKIARTRLGKPPRQTMTIVSYCQTRC